MTIECHNTRCKHHGIHDGDEGPFCYMEECQWEPLCPAPYTEDELEKDNPYNAWSQE